MAIKIADLLQSGTKVEVSPGNFLPLRGLILQEMISLFMDHQDIFLKLYSKGMEMQGASDASQLAPFLLVAPEFCAVVIALAADAKGQEADIARLPATVQLIALFECWKLSVPDPKKAGELLSVVTGQLRKLSPPAAPSPLPITGSQTSEGLSNSSPAAAIPSTPSSVTP